MGILRKKIRATTLMETLVATSIIIIVFVIASLVLNNTFRTIAQRDTFSIQNRIEKLEYLYIHNKLELPHQETFENCDILVEQLTVDGISYLHIATKYHNQKQTVSNYILDENQ